MNMHAGEIVAVDKVIRCAGVKELPLGAIVNMRGIVIGRSELEAGSLVYCIEFERDGQRERGWFSTEDLAEAA